MSTRRLTLDIPVSVFRQLTMQAKLTEKSIETVATEAIRQSLAPAIASSLSSSSTKVPRRDDVLEIVASHRQQLQAMGVKSLELFGSVARDDANVDSDIDFFVELGDSIGYFGLLKIQYYLEDILDCPVDLGMKEALREHLREPVLEEAIHVI